MTKPLILILFVALSWQAQAQRANPQSDTIRLNTSDFIDQNNGENLQRSSQSPTAAIKLTGCRKDNKVSQGYEYHYKGQP